MAAVSLFYMPYVFCINLFLESCLLLDFFQALFISLFFFSLLNKFLVLVLESTVSFLFEDILVYINTNLISVLCESFLQCTSLFLPLIYTVIIIKYIFTWCNITNSFLLLLLHVDVFKNWLKKRIASKITFLGVLCFFM